MALSSSHRRYTKDKRYGYKSTADIIQSDSDNSQKSTMPCNFFHSSHSNIYTNSPISRSLIDNSDNNSLRLAVSDSSGYWAHLKLKMNSGSMRV